MIEWGVALSISICGFSVIAFVAAVRSLQCSLRAWRNATEMERRLQQWAEAGIDIEVDPAPNVMLPCGCIMRHDSTEMIRYCDPGDDKAGHDLHLDSYWTYFATVQPSTLDELEVVE